MQSNGDWRTNMSREVQVSLARRKGKRRRKQANDASSGVRQKPWTKGAIIQLMRELDIPVLTDIDARQRGLQL